MQSNRRITRSMSAAMSANMSTSNNNTVNSNQTEIEKIDNEIEKIDNEIEKIENSIKSLQQRLHEAKKTKDELEPTITITDEYSSRTFTFKKNPYELSRKYPKVHPKTGQRLYRKTEHWTQSDYVGIYNVSCCIGDHFPDTEYAENIYDGHYKLYDSSVGWSRPGYYWHDISSDYDYRSRYVECPIPDANANDKKNNKKK